MVKAYLESGLQFDNLTPVLGLIKVYSYRRPGFRSMLMASLSLPLLVSLLLSSVLLLSFSGFQISECVIQRAAMAAVDFA